MSIVRPILFDFSQLVLQFEKQRLESSLENVDSSSATSSERLGTLLAAARIKLHQLRHYALLPSSSDAQLQGRQGSLMIQPLSVQIDQLLQGYCGFQTCCRRSRT